MSNSNPITLPEIPKDKDYEDYLCAYLQAGGLYVERSIIHREVEELLELDVLTTEFQHDNTNKLLVEIKGGNWGFNEIFKIRGWMTFLNFDKGCFIVQKSRPSISYFQDKAETLNIKLIDNSDLAKTKETLSSFYRIQPDAADVETIRFAYLIERKQLAKIKQLKKKYPDIKSYSNLDDYFFKTNSGSFFSANPINRINKLFTSFIKHKNITAKICNELNGGNFDDDSITQLSTKCFTDTFYDAKNNILHISLYVEHLARITILKCAIEHLIDRLKGDYDTQNIINQLEYLALPSNIINGLAEITKDKYFYLYPIFWQFFTYVFGGFILTDIQEKEYELLSNRTGIPIDEIPNAFDAFNKLFPRHDGWFFKFPKSSIKWHRMFPISFCGLGANYRRLIYADDKDYKNLYKMLSNDKTSLDLRKWNNLTYEILNSK